jgi:hypothetical protein
MGGWSYSIPLLLPLLLFLLLAATTSAFHVPSTRHFPRRPFSPLAAAAVATISAAAPPPPTIIPPPPTSGSSSSSSKRKKHPSARQNREQKGDQGRVERQANRAGMNQLHIRNVAGEAEIELTFFDVDGKV